jgi:hypothetical protein
MSFASNIGKENWQTGAMLRTSSVHMGAMVQIRMRALSTIGDRRIAKSKSFNDRSCRAFTNPTTFAERSFTCHIRNVDRPPVVAQNDGLESALPAIETALLASTVCWLQPGQFS